jgi:hypothetical protein
MQFLHPTSDLQQVANVGCDTGPKCINLCCYKAIGSRTEFFLNFISMIIFGAPFIE